MRRALRRPVSRLAYGPLAIVLTGVVTLTAAAQAPPDPGSISAIVCIYSHAVEDGHRQRVAAGESLLEITFLDDTRATMRKQGLDVVFQGQVTGQIISGITEYTVGARRVREQIIVNLYTGAFRLNSRTYSGDSDNLTSTFGSCERAPEADVVAESTDEEQSPATAKLQ